MGKTAFIFPGQGSQYPGMGKEISDAFVIARDAFHEADQALDSALSELCFKGPEEVLKLTHNTQPAILAVSIAILRVLEERRLRPHYVAGHSLGEYSALVCAGALTLADAVRTVRKRGQYMQEAVPVDKGAMAAVIGLDAGRVEEACREASGWGVVSPANYNSPDQVVIAGEAPAVRKACEQAMEMGARRCLPLAVSAPFHCALMAPARDRLAVDLHALSLRDLSVPLISNVDASELLRGDSARDALIRQVCAPVRWVESIERLLRLEVTTFVEIGPGRVLTGLVKKIAPGAQTYSVDGIRGIEALASALTGATM
ncbi:MAG TPA: ACP S-malonyltransferase [Acidobacteriota bacterium]|nr:ACP S-malonyltransferase [Acidobacteriota bacterium]